MRESRLTDVDFATDLLITRTYVCACAYITSCTHRLRAGFMSLVAEGGGNTTSCQVGNDCSGLAQPLSAPAVPPLTVDGYDVARLGNRAPRVQQKPGAAVRHPCEAKCVRPRNRFIRQLLPQRAGAFYGIPVRYAFPGQHFAS